MPFSEWWYGTVKKISRILEKGIYIGTGIVSFFAMLLGLFLFNCTHRFIESGFSFSVGWQCLMGKRFPLLIFFVSFLVGILSIVLTFYAVEKQRKSNEFGKEDT